MERETLERWNEWWFTGKVPAELAPEQARDLFAQLEPLLTSRQVLLVVGLRRTGKTTLLYQLIRRLLEKGIQKDALLYFSFDEKVESVEELLQAYQEQRGVDFRNERVVVFLDEIQKVPGWENQLKKYYDLYPKMKVIISGSESPFLSAQTKETLAGRVYEFVLPTLSFSEYVRFSGQNPEALPAARAQQLCTEFVMQGGFPEMMGKDGRERERYAKAVADKVVFQDLAPLTGVRDAEVMKALIETIAVNPGMYMEYQSLAKQLGKDRRSIKSYVQLLEQGFLVRVLGNYRKGRLASLRKTKRAYLTDTSFLAAYKGQVDEAFFGRMVETAVVNGLDGRMFWKNSHEVDLIGKIPIEVKYVGKVTDRDVAGLRACMRACGFRNGLLLTKNQEGVRQVPEGRITLIPVWRFLLKGK